MANIARLNRQIERYKQKIHGYEEKILKAKGMEESGKITKAEYQKVRDKYSVKARGLRGAIRRKVKARQMLEKKIKEKEKEKLKKKKEKLKKKSS